MPRLVDAIGSALYILDGIELDLVYGLVDRTTTAEGGSADVKDAFFNIPVPPGDRRATCDKVFETFTASDSLVFGAGPPPLIWGRYAVWMARSAQGLFDFRELLIQLYVDDPLWVTRGTSPQRRRATVILLLFWQGEVGEGQERPEEGSSASAPSLRTGVWPLRSHLRDYRGRHEWRGGGR